MHLFLIKMIEVRNYHSGYFTVYFLFIICFSIILFENIRIYWYQSFCVLIRFHRLGVLKNDTTNTKTKYFKPLCVCVNFGQFVLAHVISTPVSIQMGSRDTFHLAWNILHSLHTKFQKILNVKIYVTSWLRQTDVVYLQKLY